MSKGVTKREERSEEVIREDNESECTWLQHVEKMIHHQIPIHIIWDPPTDEVEDGDAAPGLSLPVKHIATNKLKQNPAVKLWHLKNSESI